MSNVPENGPSNREVLSVSDLTRSARRVLEGEFPMVFVEGEISNMTRPASGHWYFTLKDDKAQLRCAMFANRNRAVRFNAKSGAQVVVRGRVSLYEQRGDFQLIAESMEEAGDGALRRAFDKLKAQLQAEGLFEPAIKQPLPAMPRHIGVITSPTGAAIRDVLHVLGRRFPAIPVSIIPVQVQGEISPGQIVAALDFANRYDTRPFDVLLLTRGGGSLEDLWSFNTEEVARAVHASRIPVVCAVGHETDFSIADFVADLRAPTPSAAAELLSPDQAEWQAGFIRLEQHLTRSIAHKLRTEGTAVQHLSRRLRHPGQRLGDLHQRLDDLEMRLQTALRRYLSGHRIDETEARLKRAMMISLERRQARLANAKLASPLGALRAAGRQLASDLGRMKIAARSQLQTTGQRLQASESKLHAYSHERTLERGYAILRKDGKVIRSHHDVAQGEHIDALLMDGELDLTVNESRERNED